MVLFVPEADAVDRTPRVLLSASGIDYYGDTGDVTSFVGRGGRVPALQAGLRGRGEHAVDALGHRRRTELGPPLLVAGGVDAVGRRVPVGVEARPGAGLVLGGVVVRNELPVGAGRPDAFFERRRLLGGVVRHRIAEYSHVRPASIPPQRDYPGGFPFRHCARLYEIISGRDPADSTTVEVPEVELLTYPGVLRSVRHVF